MFINVTALRSGRQVRLAVAAIAYIDEHLDNSSIAKLIGGESLQLAESREAVEAAIDATMPVLVAAEFVEVRTSGPDSIDPAAAEPPLKVPAPARQSRKSRR